MTNGAMINTVYELAREVHRTIAKFADSKRDTVSQRMCDVSVNIAAQIQDALTTDDPVEQQENLRHAGLETLVLETLVKIGTDLDLIDSVDSEQLRTLITEVRTGIDRERRTVRRTPA